MDVASDIRTLGARFEGRLDASILADALEYLDHNEWGLALAGRGKSDRRGRKDTPAGGVRGGRLGIPGRSDSGQEQLRRCGSRGLLDQPRDP